MPHTIHTEALKKQWFFNPSKPQTEVPEVLPEHFIGTANQGLPVRRIEHFEFPLVVYKHPVRAFREIEHRNDRFEVVGTELAATEHLTKAIHCDKHATGGPKDCGACNAELESALAEGWTKQPYIPPALPKPDDDLYGPRKTKQETKK